LIKIEINVPDEGLYLGVCNLKAELVATEGNGLNM
jgi:hypothetical protein